MSAQAQLRETAGTKAARPGTSGVLRYLEPQVASSLYRNGKVLTRRDPNGSDGELQGVFLEKREIPIADARRLAGAERRTLAQNGFELIDRPFRQADIDFLDHEQVVKRYYQDCADAVAEATGARAYAFDHNIRSAEGKKSKRRIAGGQQVQGPAHVVHGDYTLTSGPQRLRDLSKPPSGNDTLRIVLGADESLVSADNVARVLEPGNRFAIINLWRNIAKEPVATHPMAFCDGKTVEPDDLVVFEIHYEDRIGENYFAKRADRHGWYYYPGVLPEEAILIKQWDSAGPLARSEGAAGDASDAGAPCTFSFHSAFDDPAAGPDAPDRWSIEVRCIVLYD